MYIIRLYVYIKLCIWIYGHPKLPFYTSNQCFRFSINFYSYNVHNWKLRKEVKDPQYIFIYTYSIPMCTLPSPYMPMHTYVCIHWCMHGKS